MWIQLLGYLPQIYNIFTLSTNIYHYKYNPNKNPIQFNKPNRIKQTLSLRIPPKSFYLCIMCFDKKLYNEMFNINNNDFYGYVL